MNISYLLIGGNQGDRVSNLAQARTHLSSAAGTIRAASSLYETEPWGKSDQPWFLNQALALETPADAHTLLKTVLHIEEEMGRKRMEKYGARLIDIDILFFNDAIVTMEAKAGEPGLIIPHPEIPNRRFVLEPLDEIASRYIHPVSGKSVRELLLACTDPLKVKKL